MARQLETSRTILRAWRDGDVEEWVALGADARVMEFMPSLIERADAERSAQRLREGLERDGYGWWVLEVKDVASFAGVVALQNVPSDLPFTPAFEVGWRLRYDQWGRGYATEAARAALDFAFDELGHSEVVALTAAINLRSQAVMERLGMTRDPRDDFEHTRLEPGHRLRPHVLYRIRNATGDARGT
jgi:ribosomal-protein-alanine N-acetyltransferase